MMPTVNQRTIIPDIFAALESSASIPTELSKKLLLAKENIARRDHINQAKPANILPN